MVSSLPGAHKRLRFWLSKSSSGSKSAINFKLFNLLTACCLASGLVTPAQAAVGNSAEPYNSLEQKQHLVCTNQGQHYLCEVDSSSARDGKWTLKQEAVNHTEVNQSLKSSTGATGQLLTPTQQGAIANICIWLAFFIPVGAYVGILLYDKYCTYRVAVLRKQVERLERLWHSEV